MKILVVEDEKKIAGLIKRGLEEEVYTVSVAYDGFDGLKQALTGDYSLESGPFRGLELLCRSL